jgi:hypothetical protein
MSMNNFKCDYCGDEATEDPCEHCGNQGSNNRSGGMRR